MAFNPVIQEQKKVNNAAQVTGELKKIKLGTEKPMELDMHDINEPIMLSQLNIDPLQILPFEIVTDIILFLPQDVRIQCLLVSSSWRKQVLERPEAWRVISLRDKAKDYSILSVMPFLGKYVKDLSILSTSRTVQSKFMQQLRKGHFKAIRSLTLSESALHCLGSKTSELKAHEILSSWQIENTLTRLEIDTGHNNRAYTIYIAHILEIFKNLTDLIFTTKIGMASQSDRLAMPIMTSQHKHLINLELKAHRISELFVKLIIPQCPQLRRLVIKKCQLNVLDAIVELQRDDPSSLQNLEILAYNPIDKHPPIPALQPTKAKAMKTSSAVDVVEHQQQHDSERKKGIRVIYTNNGGNPVPSSNILPLIYNNRHTLETLYVCISTMTTSQLNHAYAIYPNFKLTNIKNLTFWLGDGIRDIILRSIQGSTSLTWLDLLDMDGLDDLVVDTLLHLPPLCHIKFVSAKMTMQDRKKLCQLFSRYAQLPEGNYISQRSLKSIAIQNCSWVITQDMLEALANIKSLEEVWLGGHVVNTSLEVIHQFITRLGNQKLKGIYLHDIAPITDMTIGVVLGDIVNKLSWIKLKGLNQITDQGIRTLVNKKKRGSHLILLIIENCPEITQGCVDYARKKVKTVIYNTPCSVYYLSPFNNHYYSSSPLLM